MPSSPPKENLYRAIHNIGLERADGQMPTLVGHFAVWDQWTEIRSAYEGNFMERFSPTSMTKTLSESTPKVLFQHGRDPQIGDKVLGPVRNLAPDATGAAYEVQLLDTSYNRDLIPGIEAGLYGASFRFKVLQEKYDPRPAKSDYNPRGIPERTVLESQVAEFGPVTFPAYAGASAGLRSMTDEFLFDVLTDDPERLQHLASRSRISLNGLKRYDNEDTGCLAQMIVLATNLIAEQDEGDPVEQRVISTIQGVVQTLTSLLPGEAAEVEPTEDENSAPPDGDTRENESEPPAATTQDEPGSQEPEPSEATTPQRTSLFWFVEDPTLKGAK
jgi:phage head maturation protease